MKILFLALFIYSTHLFAEPILCTPYFLDGELAKKTYKELMLNSKGYETKDIFGHVHYQSVSKFELVGLDKSYTVYDKQCGVDIETSYMAISTHCIASAESEYTKCRVSCSLYIPEDCDYY